MEFTECELEGPLLIKTRQFEDQRGFFTERFRLDHWRERMPQHPGFIQDNFSWSKAGVLRGLHYQFNPDQGKLVTCVQGSVSDVIVDIRKHSKTLGKYLKFELNSADPKWLWVPPGFAHGFVVTSTEGAGVLYRVDQPYSPKTEGAIAWNDRDLNIDWGVRAPLVSDKDAAANRFADFLKSIS